MFLSWIFLFLIVLFNERVYFVDDLFRFLIVLKIKFNGMLSIVYTSIYVLLIVML